VDAAGDACPLGKGEERVPAGHFAYEVEFGSSSGPDPNPVRSFDLTPSPWIPAIPEVESRNQDRNVQFCRGTRLTVRTGKSVERSRATFDLGDIGSEKPLQKSGDDGDE
jgi:hypothetical protein